jgi:nucleotidyltransferase AbiEii toxin of type IV toxin-antitoxin system
VKLLKDRCVHLREYDSMDTQVPTMDIASRIATYEERGFTTERAQVNVLMEAAAFAIFRDFPEAFVLFGGATLVLFHESLRHSADLDLLSRGAQAPSREEIAASLERELMPLGEIMELGRLGLEIDNSDSREGRIFISTNTGQRLFRVDLTRLGSAIEGEIEDHRVDGEAGASAVIKSATKELLLLQKAEAFLLRRAVKARDAYDIHLLKGLGTTLGANLRAHLHDTVLANEIDSSTIAGRIDRVDVKLCTLELKQILPPDVYKVLEVAEFEPLRNAVRELYEEWL